MMSLEPSKEQTSKHGGKSRLQSPDLWTLKSGLSSIVAAEMKCILGYILWEGEVRTSGLVTPW